MRRQAILPVIGIALLAAGVAAGCGRKPSGPSSSGQPAVPGSPSPSPTPTPLNMTAALDDFSATMFDKTGKPAASIKALSVGVNPDDAQSLISVSRANATLYEKGQPAATLTAEKLVVNKETRELTATGNVVVKSLRNQSRATVRADKMVWQHDEARLIGSDNVLITMSPDVQMPGKSFEADTKLSKFSVKGNGSPVTGTL